MATKTATKIKKPVRRSSVERGSTEHSSAHVKEVKEKKETVVKPVHVEVEEEKPAKLEELQDEVLEIREETEDELGDEKAGKKEKYYQAIGRRKNSVAIVRLYTKKSTDNIEGEHALVRVNDKDYRDYFTDKTLQFIVEYPLRKLKSMNRFKVTVMTNGGGLSGQAGAIKHGISRALVLFDLNFRKKLKKSGFLTRDSRMKERRKYGLKKARKAPAWSKR